MLINILPQIRAAWLQRHYRDTICCHCGGHKSERQVMDQDMEPASTGRLRTPPPAQPAWRSHGHNNSWKHKDMGTLHPCTSDPPETHGLSIGIPATWGRPFPCMLKNQNSPERFVEAPQLVTNPSPIHPSAPRSFNAPVIMLLLISLIVLSGQGTRESLSKPKCN